MSGPTPTELAEMGAKGITLDDIQTVLTAERTTVSIDHNGNPFIEPSAEKVTISNPSCRTHDSYDGRRTELSFKVSFVLSDDDYPDTEKQEKKATSHDWGLSASRDDE